jgi:hypothetical protein
MHRDLIALFRPGDEWEKGGVETLALVWWKKARRIRGWVGAEPETPVTESADLVHSGHGFD